MLFGKLFHWKNKGKFEGLNQKIMYFSEKQWKSLHNTASFTAFTKHETAVQKEKMFY